MSQETTGTQTLHRITFPFWQENNGTQINWFEVAKPKILTILELHAKPHIRQLNDSKLQPSLLKYDSISPVREDLKKYGQNNPSTFLFRPSISCKRYGTAECVHNDKTRMLLPTGRKIPWVLQPLGADENVVTQLSRRNIGSDVNFVSFAEF
jgi:hypothetical protein